MESLHKGTATLKAFPWRRNGPLARYFKLRVAHAPGMPGTFSPPPRVSDPDMHHDMCITHMPRCMPESLTPESVMISFEVGGGENVPGIPGACTTRNFAYLVRGPWQNSDIGIKENIHTTITCIVYPWYRGSDFKSHLKCKAINLRTLIYFVEAINRNVWEHRRKVTNRGQMTHICGSKLDHHCFVMVCRLFGVKTPSEPMLIYFVNHTLRG